MYSRDQLKEKATEAIDKKGMLEVANGGTFFLDEVGELSMAMQVKLLRVIQDRTFKPLGGINDIEVDVRFIAATNKDLEQEVIEEHWRGKATVQARAPHAGIPAGDLVERVQPLYLQLPRQGPAG